MLNAELRILRGIETKGAVLALEQYFPPVGFCTPAQAVETGCTVPRMVTYTFTIQGERETKFEVSNLDDPNTQACAQLLRTAFFANKVEWQGDEGHAVIALIKSGLPDKGGVIRTVRTCEVLP